MNSLREVLEEIQAGRTSFGPAGKADSDFIHFQAIANILASAYKEGFLEGFSPHKESHTGNRWYDLVLVTGGLSDEGKIFLEQPD